MNRCEFEATQVEGEYRCRRCGARRASPHPPARIHRWCNVVDLSEASQTTRQRDRGLGDTVARWIDTATRGRGKRIAQAVARRLGYGDCGCDGRRQRLNQALPYGHADRPSTENSASALLLRMPHGLGDAVQMTVVLRHLRHYFPEWSIDVAAKLGAHSLFTGLCRQAYVLGTEPSEGEYAAVRTLAWDEPEGCFGDSPATKAERSLREVFHLQPIDELCSYQVAVGDDARRRAREYLVQITAEMPGASPTSPGTTERQRRFPVVLFHYQGNSAIQQKTLDEALVAQLVRRTIDRGLTPVILDWDRRHGLGDIAGVQSPGADHPLWQGTGTGDGETLAALIEQATAMLAIDSGPGHVAAATSTPTLIVWSGHHPLQFFAPADNVRHAVPVDHAERLRGGHSDCLEYFARRYDYRLYADRRRAIPLLFDELLHRALAGAAAAEGDACELTVDADLWVRARHLEADRTIVRDVYVEDCYGIEGLGWQPRYVVDVGAHIGSFARRVARRLAAGGRIVCVEPDGRHLAALERNAPQQATIVAAACTDQPPPVRLRSSVFEGTDNTGASRLDPTGEDVVQRITLEQLMTEFELPWIDVLKLDCEGCELSVLADSSAIDRVRLIVGEWHDREPFMRLVAERLPDWRLTILRDGRLGLFWLHNPRWADSAAS